MQRISVGDQVAIVRGNDKGKRGKVTKVLHDRGAVIVEGVNQVKRHLRATRSAAAASSRSRHRSRSRA
jgi:large subunit ribosomal protein L24